MIATILIASIIQGAFVGQSNDHEARFLRELSETSKPAMAVATLITLADQSVVGQGRLNKEARVFSEEWMNKVLSSPMREAASKVTWAGRKSADGVSKLFVRTWSTPFGVTTWSDNGVVAVLQSRLATRSSLFANEDAVEFAERRLSELLNLPEVSKTNTRWHLGSSSTVTDSRLFSGNVFRGVRTEPFLMPNGDIAEKVLDTLKWHNAMFVATDGGNLLVRINFYDADPDTLRRVSDSRTRFDEAPMER